MSRVCRALQGEVVRGLVSDGGGELKVEGGIREDDVHGGATGKAGAEGDGDGWIGGLKLGMLIVSQEVVVCGVVPCKVEGSFKSATRLEGEPDGGDRRVDEGIDGIRKEAAGGGGGRRGDGLDGHKQIARDVVAEGEGDAVGAETRRVVSAESEGAQGGIGIFVETGRVAPAGGGDNILIAKALEGCWVGVGKVGDVQCAWADAEISDIPDAFLQKATDDLILNCRGG